MSLFDLQDVCIAIGSLATLDLPMVVDLIGIYGLKGPYCTLTTTSWFLQALSVIPRGSWGDVARRFTMIPSKHHTAPFPHLHLSVASCRHAPPPPPLDRTCSDQLFEELPSVLISSGLLVQADEGTLLLVVDLIRRNLPPPTVKSQSPCDSGWSQAPVASKELPSVLISSGLLVQADEGTLLPVVDLIRRNLPPPTVKSQSPCDSGWSQAPVASKVLEELLSLGEPSA
ncbi:extra-large guanine nucleotide-binding protein 3-like [Dorcoceras hygrometricum]|uniref:Extra-large guanine nucleotide-binding protein 3-like n=1 Tax=Dorcoceras hygrometricum TaxID=472368 RepID=A0A2Z7B0R8_9LAMI|nr:extra-large guanine nucleotide-binding protein 3-like [Dorcoceras hygrometricum]